MKLSIIVIALVQKGLSCPSLHIMTGPLSHNQSLAHHPTRTFHVHSHIMIGQLAHNQSLLAHRAGARAVNLGGQTLIRGEGAKFEIKHKSRCLQKKLVNSGGQACRLGGGGRHPWPPLAPALLAHHPTRTL